MLHERLGDWLQAEAGVGEGLRTGPWVLVFVPLIGVLTAVAAVTFWPYLRDRRRAIGLIAAGFLIYGLAAVGIELAANLATEGSSIHKLLGFAEEIGEMVCANVILWAVILVVQAEGINVELGERSATV